MTKYMGQLAWPKKAADYGRDVVECTITADYPGDVAAAYRRAVADHPEHRVVRVTTAELQPDGRWTYPRGE